MLIDTNSKTFPTKYKKNDTDYAKGWNACMDSVMQQKAVDIVDNIIDNIISDILSVTPWLDGTCLVVSRDAMIDIVSNYKSTV